MMTDHMQVIYVSRVPCVGEVIFLASGDVDGGDEWTVKSVHHMPPMKFEDGGPLPENEAVAEIRCVECTGP
jgi:hypothetical protein